MTYPVYDKNIWGSKYWFTFENTMATMPKDASPELKQKYNQFGKLFTELLPCEDCSNHAKQDFSLDTTSPKNAFTSVCNLHNKTNERTGKESKDCGSLYDDNTSRESCSSCNIKGQENEGEKQNDKEIIGSEEVQTTTEGPKKLPSTVQDVVAATDAIDSLGQQQIAPMDKRIRQYNALATKIFKDLCKQHGLPVPKNINNVACPIDQSTSCNLYEGKDASVYLHPIVTSLRTIYHEFDHYKDIVTGNSNQIDEAKANNFVASTLGNIFVPGPGATNLNPNAKAAKEDDTSEKFTTAEMKEDVSNKTIGQVDRELSENVKASYYDVAGKDTSFMNNFPMLKSTLQQIESEKELVREKKVSKDGVLKHIDHLYEKPSQWTGIEKEEMNLLFTPVLFHNVVSNLIDTNMTSLGSAITNAVLGAVMIGASVYQKKTLRHRDNLLVQLLGSLFMFNALSYVNLKTLPEMKRQAKMIQSRIKQGKYNFADILIETPKMKARRDSYNQMVSTLVMNPHAARAIAGIPGVPINTNGVTPIPIQSATGAYYGNPVTMNNQSSAENVLAGYNSNLPNDSFGPTIGPNLYTNTGNTRGLNVYPNQIGLADDGNGGQYNQQYSEDANNPYMQGYY